MPWDCIGFCRHILTLSQTSPVCSTSLLKILGKGEIAHDEQFLLFLRCFLPVWKTFCQFFSPNLELPENFGLEEAKVYFIT